MTRDSHHHITVFYTVTAIVVAIAAATLLACNPFGNTTEDCTNDEQRAWTLECIRAAVGTHTNDSEYNVSRCRETGEKLFEKPCHEPLPKIVELDVNGNVIPQEKP